MDSRPGWVKGTDDPAMAVIASNNLSRMARRANQITDEVTRIKQRVDRMIKTFDRAHSALSNRQSPDMEILEDMDDLENVLHDQAQKRRYQQKLTVFIVGYQETCGQRQHLLTQLQEFFSIYSNMSEEDEDQQLVQSSVDLDSIAYQVTGAVRSAEAAMSRLADIHTGIMTYMSQTISAGAQSKWKSSHDRGRKKLEKVLEQTKVDIVQLTDQLLQAKEDLTLKDQKMKELLKQNEMRMLENQHFKTQLEVTKGSLQTLQDETAIQRSLLEAELRRQVGRLEELDNKAAVTGKQFTDASTQWEILESVLKDGEGVITDDSEEEMAEKTTLTEFTEEQNDVQNFKMELNTIEIGSAVTEEVSEPESLECNIPSFPIFDEAISDTTLYSVVEGNNSTISSVCVEEERNTSLTSLPLSQNSEPTMTQPPNISTIQLCDASEVEIHHIDKNNSEMYPATSCAELQESVMLVLTPPVSPENMMSLKDKFTQSILPPVIEEKGHSAIAHTDSAEISDGNLSLSLPSGGCNVTTSCHETDKTTQLILSVPMAEKYTSPITAISLSHKRDQWSQTDGSNTLFQESEKNNSPITLLKTDEDTNPMTTIPINDNSYTYLMISPSNIKTSADFPPPSTLEQNIHISVPADNTMTALSPSYENGDLTASIPELDQSSHNSISVPVPDVNTLHFTSLPVFDKITEVITSLSAPSDIIRPVTSPPLDSENSNIDESVHTISLIIPDHKMQPPETHEAEVTPEQNQGTLLSKDTGSINQPSEPAILCKDLAGVENKKTGWTFHTEEGEVSPVKSLDSSDHHAQLWGISQRLHKCMQEIRELLTTEGFHSLADGLTEEVEGNNADGISGNLKQLENFPAVLHSLLHTATRKNTEHKQLPDEHSQGADVTSGNKNTEKNCPLLSMHTEDGTQTCDDLSVHAPLSHDSGNTRSLIFTRLDEEHNRRVLQRARYQGRLPGHLHQDASRVMTEYRMMRQERLQVLVWRYVIYIAWKRAENLLQKQCLLRPQVTPTLTKLQKLKHQVFLRWREKMMQSQEERLSLSVALHQTLQGVQEESGIFLIKPVLSWPASSSATETRKEIRFRYKALRQPTFPSLDQDGLLCYGRAPSHAPKQWKNIHSHTDIRPLVITPKLLEMDVHRNLCKECCVMSQLRDSYTGLPLKTTSLQKNIVSVKRTPPFPAL